MPPNMTTVAGHFLRNFQMGRKSLGVARENSSLEEVYTPRVRIRRPPFPTAIRPLKFFEGVKFRKFDPLLPKSLATNSNRSLLFADLLCPLQSLKFSQKLDHYILRKVGLNIANVVTMAVFRRYMWSPLARIFWNSRTIFLRTSGSGQDGRVCFFSSDIKA